MVEMGIVKVTGLHGNGLYVGQLEPSGERVFIGNLTEISERGEPLREDAVYVASFYATTSDEKRRSLWLVDGWLDQPIPLAPSPPG